MRTVIALGIIALGILLLALTAPASATEFTSIVSWTPPDTRQNGNALPESELDFYTIEIVRGNTTTPRVVEIQSPASTYTDVRDYPNGPIMLTVRIKVTDIFGLESPWSEPATKEGVVAPGSPPMRFQVQFGVSQ